MFSANWLGPWPASGGEWRFSTAFWRNIRFSPAMPIGCSEQWGSNRAGRRLPVGGGLNVDLPAALQEICSHVYNGIALAQDGCLCRQHLADLPVGRPRILHVGRLSAQKNHEALLKSLQQMSGAYLVLVGDGELRGTLEQQVRSMGLADRVHFLGEVTPEEVRAVMNVCDLFMFPSVYEAMRMALIEAMAAGMPIVASDIPANREVLQNTGYLCPRSSRLVARRERTFG